MDGHDLIFKKHDSEDDGDVIECISPDDEYMDNCLFYACEPYYLGDPDDFKDYTIGDIIEALQSDCKHDGIELPFDECEDFEDALENNTVDDWIYGHAYFGILCVNISNRNDSTYIKLPCDSDGKPWRFGDDYVYGRDDKSVLTMNLTRWGKLANRRAWCRWHASPVATRLMNAAADQLGGRRDKQAICLGDANARERESHPHCLWRISHVSHVRTATIQCVRSRILLIVLSMVMGWHRVPCVASSSPRSYGDGVVRASSLSACHSWRTRPATSWGLPLRRVPRCPESRLTMAFHVWCRTDGCWGFFGRGSFTCRL